MAITAYSSRRVRESLLALESYLGQAADVAGGVKPSATLKLELESTRDLPSPRVTHVVWNQSKGDVIAEPDLRRSSIVTVSGDHLTHREHGKPVLDISSFKLIGADGARAYFEASLDRLRPTNDDEFEADLRLAGSKVQLGSYEARAFHVDGQTAVLPDACSIEAAKPAPPPGPPLLGPGPAGAPAPAAPAKQLQLGAMLPNLLEEDRTTGDVTLFVLNGAPDKGSFAVTTVDGKSVRGFAVKVTDEKPGKFGQVLTLAVTVPAGTADQAFCLVAKSSSPRLEDRLWFGVVAQGSNRWFGSAGI
jgi:hypothetical protein